MGCGFHQTGQCEGGMVVGDAVTGSLLRALMYTDASGNLAQSSDDGTIGAAGVNLGYLKYAEHIADHVFLGHVDANTSSTVFQVDMRQNGDLVLKAPVASGQVTIVGGISGTGAISLLVNATTSRMVVNNTGIGVFGVTPAARQVSAANLTNNVTVGGTDDTIADFSDLTTFANSAAAIRNNQYQLARKLKQINDGLRLYGWFT